MLNPPQRPQGHDFEFLRKSCANFMTFRNISEHPSTRTLKELADQFHRPQPDSQTLAFCNDLAQFAPGYPDVYKLRGICLRDPGEIQPAKNDLTLAKRLFDKLEIETESALCDRLAAGLPQSSEQSQPE